MTIALRYAARSDVGLLREGNEDSAYAGPRLLAVADGMGGHAHGEVASSVAIAALQVLDDEIDSDDLLPALQAAVREANRRLHEMVARDPSLKGMGTTLTAMLWSGRQVAVAHVGDSRAYLLRAGELYQVTDDHTLVNQLVKEGRITEDDAATHPQRSILLKALDGSSEVEPELDQREAQLGDRYLLCSDGLSGVVSPETLHGVLTAIHDPQEAVRELIDLANRGGGPDNITCVVADVVDPGREPQIATVPEVVGAAGLNRADRMAPPDTPAGRANVALSGDVPNPAGPAPSEVTAMQPVPVGGAGGAPIAEPYPGEPPTMPQDIVHDEFARDTEEVPRPPTVVPGPRGPVRRRRSLRWLWILIAVVVLLVAAVGGLYLWMTSGFSVGASGNNVVVYEGRYPKGVGPLKFYGSPKPANLTLDELNATGQRIVTQGVDGLESAEAALAKIAEIKKENPPPEQPSGDAQENSTTDPPKSKKGNG